MNLNTLSPKQIAFLYLRHKKYIEVHDQVSESIKELNKEGVETQPSLEDLENNEHVKMLEEINKILNPIYEIIADTEAEMVAEVQEIVTNPMNLPDIDSELLDDYDDEEDDEDDDSLF
jgi:hypothetical protein